MSTVENLPQTTDESLPELSKPLRRVLGTLLEKAFTTPEYYPLTLKALTAGCNQKSNRDPVANYGEEAVQEAIEGLCDLGLANVVFTESGRTERYRHFVRHRIKLTEPQLAVLTELLLRGRQSLGDLRSRASRMVPIESLDELRTALAGLREKKFVRFSGPLEQRGVEVDHDLYPERERTALRSSSDDAEADDDVVAPTATASVRPAATVAAAPSAPRPATADDGRVRQLEALVDGLRSENRALSMRMDELSERCERLETSFERLRADLGG